MYSFSYDGRGDISFIAQPFKGSVNGLLSHRSSTGHIIYHLVPFSSSQGGGGGRLSRILVNDSCQEHDQLQCNVCVCLHQFLLTSYSKITAATVL